MENNFYNTLPKMESHRDNIKVYKCFYHASTQKLSDDLVLTPRIPDGLLPQEDKYIPRISLSRSIEGSLKGTYSKWRYDNIPIYIYKIYYDEKLNIIEPSIRAVPDGYLMDELWCLSNIHPQQRHLVGIATDIHEEYNDAYPDNNITFNDTVVYNDEFGHSHITYYGEIYFNYIPAKIIKSPFIKVNNDGEEREKYLVKSKSRNHNPFDYEDVFLTTKAGFDYYNPYYEIDDDEF